MNNGIGVKSRLIDWRRLLKSSLTMKRDGLREKAIVVWLKNNDPEIDSGQEMPI